jgi:hypothetical protein
MIKLYLQIIKPVINAFLLENQVTLHYIHLFVILEYSQLHVCLQCILLSCNIRVFTAKTVHVRLQCTLLSCNIRVFTATCMPTVDTAIL